MERSDDAALLFREGEIREVQSVLRANLASDVAVAEMNARALLLTLSIDEGFRMPGVEGVREAVVPIFRERHGEGHFGEAVLVAELVGRGARQLQTLGELPVRERLKVQHPRHGVVMGLQYGVGDLRRPSAFEA